MERIHGAIVLALVLACEASSPAGSDDGTTGTAETGTAETGTTETGTTGPSKPGGPALPPRPETRSCSFDGWAPGLLAPLQNVVEFDVSVAGGSALAVDSELGFAWVGTDDGRVVTLTLDDPAAEPIGGWAGNEYDAITGLAVDGPGGFVYVRLEQSGPATAVRRYAFGPDGVLDAASMVRVLRVPHADDARPGAGLALEAAGNLIVPVGDGAIDPEQGPAQDRADRRGSVLRLDVSALVSDYDVAIPDDNPWAHEASPADEVWAIGVRDPAGCSLDPDDGSLWCFDLGSGASEATRTDSAANLGWPLADGPDCLLPSGDCYQLPIVPPDAVYRHSEDDCGTTPGAVARDGDHLDGVAVFGDRCSGAIWAADASRVGRVAEWDPAPVAFTNDREGRVWTLDAEGNIGRVEVVPTEGDFPLRLSDSGCFDDVAAFTEAPDLIPYEINAPLWTDGAHKQRHIVLPPGETIAVADDGALTFPEGTVVLKTFSFEGPVETRVMILRSLGWEFHTYEWNAAGTEATLLEERKQVVLDLADTALTYDFPSRAECGYCHGASGNAAALGPRLDQLAREVDYGHTVADQLDAFESIGVFDRPLPSVEPMADPADPEAPLEARARAYLHTNCGHCHRPGGWIPPELEMDMRWSTPTPQAAICGEPIRYYNPWYPTEFRIAPGDPGDSAIYQRQSGRGLGQMPPLATQIVDPGVDVVRAWIDSLDACPGG